MHETNGRPSGDAVGDPDAFGHNGGMGQGMQGGIEFSIRPGLPCPETVLVVMLSDGSYLLVGYPQGEPAAFTVAKDADPLHRALTAAFEGE